MGKQDASFIRLSEVEHRPSAIFLVASIANLQEIELGFGHKARTAAFDWLRMAVRHFARRGQMLEIGTAGVIEAVVELGAGDHRTLPGQLISRLCGYLNSRPVHTESGSFYILPSIGAVVLAGEENFESAKALAYKQMESWPINPCRSHDIFKYREDMKRSVRLLEKVDRGGAMLVWQSVSSADRKDPTLYFEGLLRIVDDDGELYVCEADIRALERVGLAPELDRRLTSAVLGRLEADPVIRLGVNISASSASFHRFGRDASWRDLRARLERDPGLAQRLVIEITETADFPSLDEACEFVSEMQNLGCLVAIDDFGAGRGSIIQIAALAADIIKIDGSFVQGVAEDERAYATFQHLVGLGRSLAPVVVVEGIETADQAELAQKAGGDWLQGYLFNRPSATLFSTEDRSILVAFQHCRDRFRTPSRLSSVC